MTKTPDRGAVEGLRRYWLRSGWTQYQLLACQKDQAPQGLP